jgi:SAM-dependent methyltransferase
LVKGVYQIDPYHAQFEKEYADLLGKFDTVCALNVLEHSAADSRAVANYKQFLQRGGHLILVLPASTALYHENDEGFNHWWTHNQKNVVKLLTKDFQIRKIQFFKVLGHVGWYLSGLFLQDKLLSKNASLFQQNVPLFSGVDEVIFHRTGLSVIAIAQKK